MSEEKTQEKKERVKKTIPQNVGDKDLAGYEIVAINGERFLIKTPGDRYQVCTKPWTKEEAGIFIRPIKDLDAAQSALATGKAPEPKPKAKKEVKTETDSDPNVKKTPKKKSE